MEYKIGLIIYSRLSSKRLPKKALLKIGDLSLIEQVISVSKKVNSTYHIIATSDRTEDVEFEKIAKENLIQVVRGDLENIAQRTVDCIDRFDLDYFIRINGDSPIVPYRLINDSLKMIKEENQPDVITNIFPRSFPYGYSIEIINSNTFKAQYKNFSKECSEHITKYFYNNKQQFRIINITSDVNLMSSVELTVDDEISMKRMQKLFLQYPNIQDFTLNEIVKSYNTIS